MEHEPYPEPEYKTRDCGAFPAPRYGLSFYGEWSEKPPPSGQAGHRSAKIPDRDLCSRVFLAPAQGLQRDNDSENADGVVAGEIQRERGAGSEESVELEKRRVAGHCDLGVRIGS